LEGFDFGLAIRHAVDVKVKKKEKENEDDDGDEEKSRPSGILWSF